MDAFRRKEPAGPAVAELEVLVRTAIFKPANELVGMLLQQAADRIDAAYIPKPGEGPKGREVFMVNGMFGSFLLMRQYYYHPGKKRGHLPADAALGLEMPPQLTRCRERLAPSCCMIEDFCPAPLARFFQKITLRFREMCFLFTF